MSEYQWYGLSMNAYKSRLGCGGVQTCQVETRPGGAGTDWQCSAKATGAFAFDIPGRV
jgi:hypothetical protein